MWIGHKCSRFPSRTTSTHAAMPTLKRFTWTTATTTATPYQRQVDGFWTLYFFRFLLLDWMSVDPTLPDINMYNDEAKVLLIEIREIRSYSRDHVNNIYLHRTCGTETWDHVRRSKLLL